MNEMPAVQPSTPKLLPSTQIHAAPNVHLPAHPPCTPHGWKKRFHTFNGFGYKMWWGFGFFHPVSLHNLTFFIESQEPCSSGFLLPIQRGRINNVVVFKDRFLEFALWCENILQWKRERDRERRKSGEKINHWFPGLGITEWHTTVTHCSQFNNRKQQASATVLIQKSPHWKRRLCFPDRAEVWFTKPPTVNRLEKCAEVKNLCPSKLSKPAIALPLFVCLTVKCVCSTRSHL